MSSRAELERQRLTVVAIASANPDLPASVIAKRVGVGYQTAMKWIKGAGVRLQTPTERSLALSPRRRRTSGLLFRTSAR